MSKDILSCWDIVLFMDKIVKKSKNKEDMAEKIADFMKYLNENEMIDIQTSELLGLMIYVNKDAVAAGETTFAKEYQDLLESEEYATSNEEFLRRAREEHQKSGNVKLDCISFFDRIKAIENQPQSPGCGSSSISRC